MTTNPAGPGPEKSGPSLAFLALFGIIGTSVGGPRGARTDALQASCESSIMRKKLMGMAGGIALPSIVALIFAAFPAQGAVDGPIGEAMTKLFKGPNAASAQLKTALKNETPDWKTIQGATKVFADEGPKVIEHAPPKGDPAAYKKLATELGTESKKLDEAARKEDLAATKASFGKIGASCKSCHSAHRP